MLNERRIFIHVGLQKTASSFLQRKLFPNLPGVGYIGRPYTQENHAFNALQYADGSLYNEDEFRAEMDLILDQYKEKTLIFSDELFAGYAHCNFINRYMIAERFSKVMPNAEIIIFLRGQSDLILSLYNQYVKSGRMDRYIDENVFYEPGEGFSLIDWSNGERGWKESRRKFNFRGLFSVDHFKYSYLYDTYAKLFEKVHVFLYEDFLENKESTLSRMASLIPIDKQEESNFDWVKQSTKKVSKVVNPRLNRDDLASKLSRNKLANHFSDLNPFVYKVLERSVKKSIDRNRLENIEYINSILRKGGVFEDNIALNAKLGLGMEKYPAQYFKP